MKRHTSSYYIKGILDHDRVILSQSITLIESTKASDQLLAQEIITGCLPYTGKSIRIGITGVPGVGKSTFIESFGTYLTSIHKKIAVLAVDPTSQDSKGSILGDKTRMDKLSVNPNAYIRPSASGNTLGGVAQKTQETVLLCEAAGYDVILIETVGVGQSEIEVKHLTDFFLLLMIAGAGDELQGIKRGIMEMADAILINKAEGDNLPKAKLAKREYKNAIHLFPPKESGWIAQVELCSAIKQEGIKETWNMIDSFVNTTSINGFFEKNRKRQNMYWFEQRLKEEIITRFKADKENSLLIEELKNELNKGNITPFEASRILFERQ